MAVARRTAEQPPEMPADLLAAIESGVLTQEQLRQLIAIEAADLGLSYDEAVRRARNRSLPKSALGSDIELLVELLAP